MPLPIPDCTPESIARERSICLSEREALRAKGIPIAPDELEYGLPLSASDQWWLGVVMAHRALMRRKES